MHRLPVTYRMRSALRLLMNSANGKWQKGNVQKEREREKKEEEAQLVQKSHRFN